MEGEKEVKTEISQINIFEGKRNEREKKINVWEKKCASGY